MDVSGRGDRLFLGYADGSLVEYDRSTGRNVSWKGHGGSITAVRLSENPLRVVSTSKDNYAKVWVSAAQKWEEAHSLKRAAPVQDAAVVSGLDWAFIATADGSVDAVKLDTGLPSRAPNGRTEGAMSVMHRARGG